MIDSWRVNSYGYPNPFQSAPKYRVKAGQAWDMFVSFADRTSYREVKRYWEQHPERPVDAHTVESWKATFEEFGLLYVLQRADEIVTTPGGLQLLASADADDLEAFCWVGVNLLLRYPLSGVSGRRSRGSRFASSDLLLYWYLFACLLDHGGLWQSEFYHLATAFTVDEARQRSAFIPLVRADPSRCTELANFNENTAGGVYNALNQVMVHGSLNHVIFSSEAGDSPYGRRENWWYVKSDQTVLLEAALGGAFGEELPSGCAAASSFVDRMPVAKSPIGEFEYFEYLGAEVAPRGVPRAILRSTTVDGEYVPLLKSGEDFVRVDVAWIRGKVASLCTLTPGMRVILSDDLTRSYKVMQKSLAGADVTVELRPAKKIADPTHLAQRFEAPAT
jgi:hypothetical protein